MAAKRALRIDALRVAATVKLLLDGDLLSTRYESFGERRTLPD